MFENEKSCDAGCDGGLQPKYVRTCLWCMGILRLYVLVVFVGGRSACTNVVREIGQKTQK